MLGRLIIALLVICSAAAVVWQKRQAETATVAASLVSTKADDAEARAAAAEQRAAEAEQRAVQAAAKAKLYEDQIEAQRKAQDDAVEEELSLHIYDFAWTGVGKDVTGALSGGSDGSVDAHFSLTLDGPAGTITHARLLSADGGVQSDSDMGLALLKGGVRLRGRDPILTTSGGVVKLDVASSELGQFVPGNAFVIELTRGDGHVLKQTATVTTR